MRKEVENENRREARGERKKNVGRSESQTGAGPLNMENQLLLKINIYLSLETSHHRSR